MGQQANVPASVGCGSIWFFFVCHSPSTGALNFGSGATPAKWGNWLEGNLPKSVKPCPDISWIPGSSASTYCSLFSWSDLYNCSSLTRSDQYQ